MDILYSFLKAFVVGGALCAVGEILVDRTKLTPARILSSYVVAGVILGAVGLYQPLADWAEAGATVPLTGFGNTLVKGVRLAVHKDGIIGAFIGGFSGAAGGIAAAVFFGVIVALVFKSKDRG